MEIPVQDIAAVAKHGSPGMLHAAGRIFGLGQAEQQALVRGRLPRWLLFTVGIGGGVLLGIYADRRWPQQTRKLMGGR